MKRIPCIFQYLLLGLCLGFGSPALAQGELKNPKEVQEIAEIIADMEWLRSLNPLKLTSDQCERLRAGILAARADYEKKINSLAISRLSKMTEEIRATRQKVLRGGEMPKDLEERLKQAETDFLKKRDELNAQNILRLNKDLKAILTKTQIATAAKLSKASAARRNLSDKGTDEQWLNDYIVNIFINYPRITTLLKEMQDVAQESNGGNK